MTDDKANDLSGIRARDLLPDVTVPLKTDNPFEVPDGDFDFTHEEGETFSFLFDGTLVAEMSLGGVRLYGEHAADLSAKAFWKAMLVHNPYQGIVGRLTTRTEDLEALLRESANLIDTLRKDVEPLGDPLAFVTGESGREELERLREENVRLAIWRKRDTWERESENIDKTKRQLNVEWATLNLPAEEK